MTTIAPSSKPRVLVFAVDHTLTATNTWYELTHLLGGDQEFHFQLYQKLKKGEIDQEEAVGQLIGMLEKAKGGKIHREELIDIFFHIPLRGEAFSVIGDLRDRGYTIVLSSSSIDLFVELVAQRLRVKHWFANSTFEFDDEGYWTHFTYRKNEAELKLSQLSEFLQKEGVKDNECLVIGEDDGDLELFKKYPAIALDSKVKEIRELAWKEIKYLPTLLQILESLSSV